MGSQSFQSEGICDFKRTNKCPLEIWLNDALPIPHPIRCGFDSPTHMIRRKSDSYIYKSLLISFYLFNVGLLVLWVKLLESPILEKSNKILYLLFYKWILHLVTALGNFFQGFH
jgi:hypothetical protein